MTPAEGQETCSTISRNRQEPVLGTAPRVEVWLLLTYAGGFGERAFEESELPEAVKRHLAAELERNPRARLQLISPHPAQDKNRIELFVALGRELDPFYYRFQLADYGELLDLAFETIQSSEPGVAGEALREPLYLVCTNGRRDPCCAQFGVPVFQALHNLLGDRVRQSSHVGGHRFAANVLMFPHGLCYGRVEPDQVADLVEAGQRGRIVLDRMRGRACYSPVAQAAEALLRQEVRNDDLNAYRLGDEQQVAESRWRVSFEDRANSEVHRISIESFTSEERDRVSCWSDKLAPVTRYRLRSHDVQA